MLPHTEVHLRVRPEMTVQELKHAIESCAQIPAENQILIYNGSRLLSPDESLQQAGVGPAAVMHLVLQLRRPQATVTRGAALLRGISSRALGELAVPPSAQPPPPSSSSDPAVVRMDGKAQSFPSTATATTSSSGSSNNGNGSGNVVPQQRGPQL